MGKKSQQNSKPAEQKDIRVAATSSIWGFGVAIMAISIPLVGITRNAIIPLAAIGGATIGTVAVWRSDSKKYQNQALPAQQVELLEERIANLEAIISGSDYDLQMKLRQLEVSNYTDKKRSK